MKIKKIVSLSLFLIVFVFSSLCFAEEKTDVQKFTEKEISNSAITYKTVDYEEKLILLENYEMLSDYIFKGKNSVSRCGFETWKIDDDGILYVYEQENLHVTIQKISRDSDKGLLHVLRNNDAAIYSVTENVKIEFE